MAKASRFDSVRNTRNMAGAGITGDYPKNDVFSHSTSYVTGSHNLKMGAQWRHGTYKHTDDANADLIQHYLNGVPDTVRSGARQPIKRSTGTPTIGILRPGLLGVRTSDAERRHSLGIFQRAALAAQDAPAGRFVPARHFDEVDATCRTGRTGRPASASSTTCSATARRR